MNSGGSTKRRRRCRETAAALLLALGVEAAMAQAGSDAPPVSPPGEMIDLGGWRVHLHCIGDGPPGQPTVMLEAGAGGFSVDWSLVQPEVAKFARVCSYDRAGLGWSEMGPHPRTLRQVVWELHTLLGKAGVKRPIVLVGHSAGGILARLYAFTYPAEVAAMVLEESGHEHGTRVLREGKMVRLVDTAIGRSVPDIKTAGPLHESDIPSGALQQIQAAARKMAPYANASPRDKLPLEARRMRAWAFAQVKHYATNNNPFEAEELQALLKEMGKEYPLGEMPLIVLSRGVEEHDGPAGAALEAEHRQNQADLVRLSRNGKQIIATRSGHHISLDEPDLVVSAIREILALTSKLEHHRPP